MHRGHGPGAEQPALALLHVIRAPVVVGPGLGLGEVDVALALQAEQHRRVQHGQVDVVLVHVLQPGLGVPRRRPGLGVAHLAAEGPGPVLVARPGDTGRRQPVGRRPRCRCRRATPRRPRRSRCARSGPGTSPARSRAWPSGARGCGRPSRCSARLQPSSSPVSLPSRDGYPARKEDNSMRFSGLNPVPALPHAAPDPPSPGSPRDSAVSPACHRSPVPFARTRAAGKRGWQPPPGMPTPAGAGQSPSAGVSRRGQKPRWRCPAPAGRRSAPRSRRRGRRCARSPRRAPP